MTQRKATPKQRKVLLGRAEGKTQAQAAILAGYSPRSAHVTGHEILKKHKSEFVEILEKAGVSDEKLAAVIVDGLDAWKRTECGEDKDYAVRHKYVETCLDIKGHKAPVKQELDHKGIPFEAMLESLRLKKAPKE